MPPPQALVLAKTKGLDLVEISPTAVPPVCRIMDFGKFQYEQQKRARQAKKHQKVILVKEIKFRPKVDEHDYQFKKKHIERFLGEGDKVKATIFFRGRENAHPEIGRRILERLIEEISEIGTVEQEPQKEGNQLHTILAPKAQEELRGQHAENQEPPWRREALQEDRDGQVPARQGVQAPHPDEQADAPQAPRPGDGSRFRPPTRGKLRRMLPYD